MNLIPPSSGPRSGARVLLLGLVALFALGAWPRGASAQFGPIDTLARRVSDLGFFYSRGTLAGGTGALASDAFGVTAFGVELLFEVAEVASAEARRRQAEAEPVERRVLTEVEVVTGADGRADTIYHYEVLRSRPEIPAEEILWTLEVGIGYGQVQGLELRESSLELNTTIRTLPSLTLYLSYEPLGTYLGLRTGFLRTHAMQVVDAGGSLFTGEAEAFMMGGVAGYAFGLGPTWLFLEGGYTVRDFPSVEWSGEGPLPDGVPRQLDASGWGVAVGLQFPVS